MNALVLLLALCALPEQTASVDDTPILYDQGRRIRTGFSVQGGFQTTEGLNMALEVDFRIGMQVTQWWSAYGIAKLHFASSPTLVAGVFGGAIEVMMTNNLALAVGPVVGYGSFSGVDLSDGPSRPRIFMERSGGSSFKPGFDVKVSLSTASSRPPKFNRGGFNIGLELVGLAMLDTTIATGFVPMGATTKPLEPFWIFSPMLSMGFDFR